MTRRVAISGFGRIGRKAMRFVLAQPELELVAINDLGALDVLAFLANHDSVHPGMRDIGVSISDGGLVLSLGGRSMRAVKLSVADPTQAPWGDLGIDVVLECTGRFRSRQELSRHLSAGARRVVLSAPAKDELDLTVVMGVNDNALVAAHRIVSAASCTTNCLAPIYKVLDQSFGIAQGLMTTVHAYTNDQVVLDGPHDDLRRARAAALNIVPTSTGAATAVRQVYPRAQGRLHGTAVRVPVAAGSLVDLTFTAERDLDVQAINQAIAAAAAGPMRGIIRYSEEPLVSSDIIGDPASAIFDAGMTMVLGKRMAKILAWYDNEWGYSARLVDVGARIAALGNWA